MLGFFEDRLNRSVRLENQRLYNNLGEFKNLVEIRLYKDTNDGIQVFEYIIESCKSLKSISMTLSSPNTLPSPVFPNTNDYALISSRYTPSLNVKSLDVFTKGSLDYNVILYIVHKFPLLHEYSLSQHIDYPHFNIYLVTLLLDYINTINEFHIQGLEMNQDDVAESIGYLWRKTPKLGSEDVKIVYSEFRPNNANTVAGFSKMKYSPNIMTTIMYPADIMDSQRLSCKNFIRQNGKYICNMIFSVELNEAFPTPDKSEVTGNLLLFTCLHCSNLQTLHFVDCILMRFPFAEVDFSRSFVINELHLYRCTLDPDVMETLSPVISDVKRLHLENSFNYTPQNGLEDDDIFILDINMPYTNINCVSIGNVPLDEFVNLKLFVAIEQKSYYYQVKPDFIEVITEDMFERRADVIQLHVSCLKKPLLIEVDTEYKII